MPPWALGFGAFLWDVRKWYYNTSFPKPFSNIHFNHCVFVCFILMLALWERTTIFAEGLGSHHCSPEERKQQPLVELGFSQGVQELLARDQKGWEAPLKARRGFNKLTVACARDQYWTHKSQGVGECVYWWYKTWESVVSSKNPFNYIAIGRDLCRAWNHCVNARVLSRFPRSMQTWTGPDHLCNQGCVLLHDISGSCFWKILYKK